MRATLIHNPDAGDGKPSRADLEEILRDAGLQVRYQSSKKDWKKALKVRSDLVVAAGGDGTVAKVIRELSGSGRAIALFPIGTANNIARTATRLGDARELVKTWHPQNAEPFDLGVATVSDERHLFVEGAGGGVFADAIAEGKGRVENSDVIVGSETDRALAFLRGILESAPAHTWRVEIDGTDHSGEYLGVEAMNIRHIGPSVPIAPAADPRDGLLDVVFVRQSDRAALLDYVDNRLKQHEVKLPDLTVVRARQLVLSLSGGRLRVDDDLLEDHRAVEIRIMAGAGLVIGADTRQSDAPESLRKGSASAG